MRTKLLRGRELAGLDGRRAPPGALSVYGKRAGANSLLFYVTSQIYVIVWFEAGVTLRTSIQQGDLTFDKAETGHEGIMLLPTRDDR